MATKSSDVKPEPVSISPLLNRLAYPATAEIPVSAEEIASAFALIFDDRLSVIQTAALLTLLHSTGMDRQADVIAKCSERMREAASQTDKAALKKALKARAKPEGTYRGGVVRNKNDIAVLLCCQLTLTSPFFFSLQCDIVGTGGDSHSTFNVSTTASILASPLLIMAKHGNRAQTSLSGAADLLNAVTPVSPKISAINAFNLPRVYEATNYAFLFAPNFHPGMMYANPVRRGLGLRTIFNLMGPLANPIDWALEVRMVGVAYQSLGPVFAEALRQSGSSKALVVCGEEDMDEISCAGKTNCWRLSELPNNTVVRPGDYSDETSEDDVRPLARLDTFQLHPSDFGLPTHPLTEVYGRKTPKENAAKLMSILRNELRRDDPILDFVIMNVAALLTISGVCEADSSDMGPGDDGKVIKERGPGGGRWKEGVRRARWALESGRALETFQQFIEVTRKLDQEAAQ